MGCSYKMSNPFIVLLLIIITSYLYQTSYSQQSNLKIISLDTLTKSPSALLISADNSIFILSTQENKILKLDNLGSFLKKIEGKGWGNLNFDNPTSFYSYDGLDIYVADYHNKRVQRFNRNLEYLNSFNFNDNESNIKFPFLVGIDKFSNLFVYDVESRSFYKYSKDTKLERIFGELEFSGLKNTYPKKLEFDSKNNLYVLTENCIYIYSNWGFLLREIKIDGASTFTIYNDRLFVVFQNELFEYTKAGEISKYNLEEVQKVAKIIKDVTFNNTNIFFLTDEAIIILPINQLLNWKRK